MGDTEYATFDATEIRAMHYMMLSHNHTKSPGRYRRGPIYVHDERNDRGGLRGTGRRRCPPSWWTPSSRACIQGWNSDPVVRSAMAHLNLVMIHPFRDGNGRMARALATLVLTRSDIGEPEFSSIEEWLGANARTTTVCWPIPAMGRGSRAMTPTCGWHSTFVPITCRRRP